MDALRSIDHKRVPAPSGQYPRTHLRSELPLTVDPPRDPDYRAFLADVAAQLAKLEGTPYRLRSCQPTLCNYWHFTARFGVCWKCSQVTRAFVSPSITPPNWGGETKDPPPNDASFEERRACWLSQGAGGQ